MKALRRRIQDARKADGVDQLTVERDYAQSYVLYGLAETPELREALVFKGGTALKKVHFGRYRFSEDLDFSMIDGPSKTKLENAIRSAVARTQRAVHDIAPIAFTVERYEERDPHPGGQEAFVVRVRNPSRQKSGPTAWKRSAPRSSGPRSRLSPDSRGAAGPARARATITISGIWFANRKASLTGIRCRQYCRRSAACERWP